MVLTKETVIDKIEIVGRFRTVQTRYATIIKEGGKEISRKFTNRKVFSPSSELPLEPEIRDICAAVHTEEIKTAHAAFLTARKQSKGSAPPTKP